MQPTTPLAEPRLLDVKGAAAYLSTTVWCVRSLVWSKKLGSIRLGKKILFDRQTLDQFVDNLRAA
jgi:excisionase family DNA binding protein